MKIGVLVSLTENIAAELKKVHDLGLTSCQICGWDISRFTDENAYIINECKAKYGIEVSTFWCGWSQPIGAVWNFYEGPHTIGLLPLSMRELRSNELKRGSDFARKIHVQNIATHVGFIPEVPTTEQYESLIVCLRDIAEYVKQNGQYFLFETGQETPVTLRRAIEDIGTGNLGINLDPANLILYGKGNPIDALDVFGDLVRDIHGKDGCYPTNGRELGLEMPMGQGRVDYPRFIRRLKEIGYDGPITIEREIEGDEQIRDIKLAINMLTNLIG